MTILYTLFLYFLCIRFFSKDGSRKSIITIGSIITALVFVSGIPTIISAGILYYLSWDGWQLILSYVILLIYALFGTGNYFRSKRFTKKYNSKVNEKFKTYRSRGLAAIIIGLVVLTIGAVLLVVYIMEWFTKIPYIVFIASFAGFVILLVFGIIMMNIKDERFILIIKTDEEFYTYSVEIKEKYSFNYMQYISEIYKYYIVERLATIMYFGSFKEVHYVWGLKTENLNNYDISNLKMNKDQNYWYKELVDDFYKNKGFKYKIKVDNESIESINRR